MLKENEYNVSNVGNYFIENCYQKHEGWTLEKVKILRDTFLKKYEDLGLRRFKRNKTEPKKAPVKKKTKKVKEIV